MKEENKNAELEKLERKIDIINKREAFVSAKYARIWKRIKKSIKIFKWAFDVPMTVIACILAIPAACAALPAALIVAVLALPAAAWYFLSNGILYCFEWCIGTRKNSAFRRCLRLKESLRDKRNKLEWDAHKYRYPDNF